MIFFLRCRRALHTSVTVVPVTEMIKTNVFRLVPLSRVFEETVGRVLLVASSCRETLVLCFLVKSLGLALELSCSSMAWTMGTIMAVVAVLLIHMDKKAVTAMNPSINLGNGGKSANIRPSRSERG